MDEAQGLLDRARAAAQEERWREAFEVALAGIEQCPASDRPTWVALRSELSLAVTQLADASSQEVELAVGFMEEVLANVDPVLISKDMRARI